jgi:hypothetical protein
MLIPLLLADIKYILHHPTIVFEEAGEFVLLLEDLFGEDVVLLEIWRGLVDLTPATAATVV